MKEQITAALVLIALILTVQAFINQNVFRRLRKAESRIATLERSVGFIVQD